MAHIEGPRREGSAAWQDRLWLLVTGAGLLLLVFAVLSV